MYLEAQTYSITVLQWLTDGTKLVGINIDACCCLLSREDSKSRVF